MKILFICTGNSFRSTVAEALTKKNKSKQEPRSAGIRPANTISGTAKKLLRKDNAEQYLKNKPEKVSQTMIDDSDQIIIMEKLHNTFLEDHFDLNTPITNWKIRDPVRPDVDPEKVYKELKSKVEDL